MPVLRYLPGFIPAMLAAVPAHASGGTALPEPSSLLLLGMGITGLLVGRKLAARKRSD